MHTWPEHDRPRERLKEKGPAALGDAELLALVLGTGAGQDNAVESARRILGEVGGVERLARQGLRGLASLPGVGEAKASRIAAALELGVRVIERRSGAADNGRFNCSADIYKAFRARLTTLTQEVLLVVGLNNRNEPVCEVEVARGSLSECQVGPREVFRPLIAETAARTVIVHNHPSGDCTPSPFDVVLTRRLAEVGELIGIPVIDHIVVGRGNYASLRDLGLLVAE
ncbi:MAG: DNA repair protein RadC [Deltaproteobacteria bacterium]|nr:DNA repair protein RadC [Deltaproteobacteria bacterium]